MVTDGWEAVRTRVARLLGRGDAERERAAAAEFDHSKESLAGQEPGTAELVRPAQEEAWRARLVALLEHDLGAVAGRDGS
jgi:hypothetical protein